MRPLLLLLPLLLTGCVNDSASYAIEGNDHAISVRAEQEYFWDESVTLYVTASRLPDCQRRYVLKTLPIAGLQLALLSNGDDAYTLKTDQDSWAVETQQCNQIEPPGDGQPVGVFTLVDGKLSFTPAAPPAAAP
ncbi:MAG TPA: hypothetical protein VFF16_01130 [Telluria sp.]|nr:hypothetical protein [Telluria sp.]